MRARGPVNARPGASDRPRIDDRHSGKVPTFAHGVIQLEFHVVVPSPLRADSLKISGLLAVSKRIGRIESWLLVDVVRELHNVSARGTYQGAPAHSGRPILEQAELAV